MRRDQKQWPDPHRLVWQGWPGSLVTQQARPKVAELKPRLRGHKKPDVVGLILRGAGGGVGRDGAERASRVRALCSGEVGHSHRASSGN